MHALVSLRSIVATTLPAAAAIAVFGTRYGAGARVVLGVPLTLASSLLVFSGALQFAMVALLIGGAATLAVLLDLHGSRRPGVAASGDR